MGHEKAQNGQKEKLSMRAVQPDKAAHATMTKKIKITQETKATICLLVCLT